MDEQQLHHLLSEVSAGRVSPDDALHSLRRLPFETIGGFAHLDTHRDLRTGFPEVIFCGSKTEAQILAIAQAMAGHERCVLATRMSPETAAFLDAEGLAGQYHEAARCYVINGPAEPEALGAVVVAAAGTSDLPVAEEAAVTAETMGSRVERLYDVGVAGLHRLLHYAEPLMAARAVVVVAGMEGALPSVVGGLVRAPVIAVPTSVGYGASFGGLAALLGMLNSCASGVGVVNIDNGFGGGYLAHLINWQASQGQESVS